MFEQKKIDLTVYNTATGTFNCSQCEQPLFEAAKKFEAGCGFPSFWQHIDAQVQFNPLNTYGRQRMQLLCSNCGQHLGHLFDSPHTPTKVRYCINANAIRPLQ